MPSNKTEKARTGRSTCAPEDPELSSDNDMGRRGTFKAHSVSAGDQISTVHCV